MSRLSPLKREEMPEFEELFCDADRRGREVPNLLRVLARKPEILRALRELRRVTISDGKVSKELKNMVAQLSSLSAGCNYCAAHNAGFAIDMGLSAEKEDQLWNYETSDLFTEAERAALRLAQSAVQTPNAVTDEDFDNLKQFYDEEAIVELLSVIGVFGFYNRVNDTLATKLESYPKSIAERHLTKQGWVVGKHG
ncbi:MAG: carboxymuconolactone decarboxylase family protein [Alphaproteobacteria bacterium]|jgi:uncharacterized peroxidase-related enzyme|tara:strand:+ start:156 stop:743 length:588 start_codon:yes stop_codon:yes gene_type:complete